MRHLLAELEHALAAGRRCVWCAVVETRGSTPQKAGAAMLVFPDGGQRGTLGGGCVEAEVKNRALAVLTAPPGEAPRPEVMSFCLDDDYGWDDGLICGGRMTILADPIAAGDRYHRAFRELVERGGGCVEAVVINDQAGAPAGSRYLFDAAGRLAARRGEADVPPALQVPDLARRPGPSVVHGVAYLPVLPRVTLVIVGGGHVGQAVGRLAAEADFAVEVIDDRDAYASAERFPQARRFVGDIAAVLRDRAAELGPSHYALIVTRGHRHDEEALYHLAATAAGYVGMIGSKRKIKLIFEDLIARGISPEALGRIYAPLGFDIGSQTVPEIAISIVAELIAVRNLGAAAPRPRVRVQPGTLRDAGAAS